MNMSIEHQTDEERTAGLVEVGRVYELTDCKSAALIVTVNGVGFQFNDPRVFHVLVLKHCSERKIVKHKKGEER